MVVDPLSLVGAILGAIAEVQRVTDQVEVNARKCRRLALRVSALGPPLTLWNKASARRKRDEVVEALQALLDAVKDSEKMILKYGHKNWLKKVLSNNRYREDFEDLYARLDACAQAVLLLAPFTAFETPEEHLKEQEAELDDLKEAIASIHALRLDINDNDRKLLEAVGRLEARLAVEVKAKRPITRVAEISRGSIEFSDTLLGRGANGEVVHARWDGEEVAVKKLVFWYGARESEKKEFMAEIQLMSQLNHPNIVRFYGAATEREPYLIVMELMQGGSLQSAIKRSDKRPPFPLRTSLEVLLSVARGLAYLHARGILHRDLKAANVLCRFDKEGRISLVKIADFGLAKAKAESQKATVVTGVAGSPAWMAPEVMQSKPYNKKADIYSFAMFCFEVLSGANPHEGKTDVQVMFAVVYEGGRPTLPSSVPPKLRACIEAAWDADEKKRPTADGMVETLKALLEECPHEATAEPGFAELERAIDAALIRPRVYEGTASTSALPTAPEA